MIQPQSITFFIDRCLGNKGIVEKLRGAGISVEIHDDHFSKNYCADARICSEKSCSVYSQSVSQ